MTLNEYIDKLIEFRDKENVGELDILINIDNENIAYEKIYNTLSIQKLKKLSYYYYISPIEEENSNYVCIN